MDLFTPGFVVPTYPGLQSKHPSGVCCLLKESCQGCRVVPVVEVVRLSGSLRGTDSHLDNSFSGQQMRRVPILLIKKILGFSYKLNPAVE